MGVTDCTYGIEHLAGQLVAYSLQLQGILSGCMKHLEHTAGQVVVQVRPCLHGEARQPQRALHQENA